MAWWEEGRPLELGYSSIWLREDGPSKIAYVAAIVAIGYIVAVVAFAQSGVPLALAVPLGATLGPAGVWGVAFGALFGGFVMTGIGLSVVTVTVGTVVTAILGQILWLQLAYPFRRYPGTAAVAIIPVAIVGTTAGVGIVTIANATFGNSGVFATLPTFLALTVIMAIVLSPPIVVAHTHWGNLPVCGMTIPPSRWIATILVMGIVTALWLLGATLLSLVRADVRANPDLRIQAAERFPPVIDHVLLFASGAWGWILQLLMVGVAAVAIGFVLRSGVKPPEWRNWIGVSDQADVNRRGE